MKIKLAVSRERYAEVERLLTQRGITVDADGDFVLTENNRYPDRLMVRDGDSGERVILPVEDIVLIEAFGHSLAVRAPWGKAMRFPSGCIKSWGRWSRRSFCASATPW